MKKSGKRGLLAGSVPVFEKHERFLKNISVDSESGCWNFKCTGMNGYGAFSINNKTHNAHRVSLDIFKGSLSSGMVIDHICRNRSCVNPDHLREVSKRKNNLENSLSPVAINNLKTHCKRGHRFTKENTYKSKKGRGCLMCRFIYDTERNLRISIKNKEIKNG